MPPKRLSAKQRRLVVWLVPGSIGVILASIAAIFVAMDRGEDYVPGQEVEGITRELEREPPEGFEPIAFRDVTRELGVDFTHFDGSRSSQLPEDMGSGVAWGDYDGDGDPDLYVVNEAGSLDRRDAWGESPASNRLYRNDGDAFTDVTAEAGVAVRQIGMAAAWGDFDSDRDLDLLVTSYGSILLFRNDGNGRFSEIGGRAGLRREGFWAGASWGDFDRDGDLDLYVCGYVRYTEDPADRRRTSSQYASVIPASLNPSTYSPHPNVLFENNGDGTFSDSTARAGVTNEKGRSLGAAWCDFDDDGWSDLYVANDISDNVLYRNRGDGSFEDISHAAWVADYRGAMGLAVGDWDNDLDLDIFVSHWIAQENALYLNLTTDRKADGAKWQGAMNFVDDADRYGLGQIALDYVGWGAFFFDFDNDGRLDLFVANGSTFQSTSDERRLVAMKPLLFWNHGKTRGFFEVGSFCGEFFDEPRVGRGAACADYDGDGDVDLAVVHHAGPVAILRNEGRASAGHWLSVRLRGSGKNTFGVGAKIIVRAGEVSRREVVGATPSYLSQPDLAAHFGLGATTSADSVEIEWPSGKRSRIENVAADRVLTVEEPRE